MSEIVRIRNSMIKDWYSLCQLAFKARWFGSEEEKKLMSLDHVQAIRWGSYFEQLVIGSGVGGKVIELSTKEVQAVYYERVKRQAKEARRILLQENNFHFLKGQVQLLGEVVVDGIKIPVEGNIDMMFSNSKHDPTPSLNIDLKSTADAENEFGDYAWGKPETMDMGQMVMYRELVLINYNVIPLSRYYVADLTKQERVEYLEPDFSEEYIYNYFSKVKDVFIGINKALNFDYWVPDNSYNTCKNCPLVKVCNKAVKTPSIKIVNK